jgi:proteasome accessory factor B
MAHRITRTQRWLDLITFLVQRRFPVAAADIMAAVPAYAPKWESGDEKDRAAVRRMFERDKDDLRDLGVPIETVPYTIDYGAEHTDGYRLSARDFYLPYLRILGQARGEAQVGAAEEGGRPPSGSGEERPPGSSASVLALTDDEASAAADALSRVAGLPGSPFLDESRSALRKLAFDLDIEGLTSAPVLYVDPPGGDDLRDRVRTLLDAVRVRKKASFTYHGIHRDATTERAVAPYGLLFQHGHWYLIGHCDLRDTIRVFRLDRMEGVEVNQRAPKTPDYDVPDSFDLAAYTDRRPWELGEEAEPVRARVRFEFPRSLWASRNGYGVRVEARPGGVEVRELEVHQVDPFLRWVLGQAGEAAVEAPEALRVAYDDLVQRTRAVYSSSAGGESP